MGQVTDWREEQPAYYISRDWPKSRQPGYFDSSQYPGTEILESNFEAIRDEILEYYRERGDEIRPNFTPYAYREEGWRTANLYSYFLRYKDNCKKFPVIDSIVRKIPNMSLCQIAVLEPNTRIKAHFGDTNGLIRSHLGILIPAGLPDLGIRVLREDQGWGEGQVFSISIAHRHYAWNNTDRHRIVLVVDVVRPELVDRKYEVASNALAVIAMKFVATKMPWLKSAPKWMTKLVQTSLAMMFRLRLWYQRMTDPDDVSKEPLREGASEASLANDRP